VRRAANKWAEQLIDLGYRNSLLYFRDLKSGSLDLASAEPSALADLFDGKSIRLSRLFPDQDQRLDASRRVRAIRKKAQENFEERGLETLFLARGMARWQESNSNTRPQAPISLGLLTINPAGAAQEDFSVALSGEPEVSPTLLHLLESEFDVRINAGELERRLDDERDQRSNYDKTVEWLLQTAVSVPGFAIDDRAVIGNFSYAKLPMVNDLERHLDALIASDLIAAISGDEDARAAVNMATQGRQPPGPDDIPLTDEFLVLDADASQNAAINAVLGGASLIIKGPPGTGKSQTIANLITSLVAHGQKVLFVAEKRAAIDAVLKRLQNVGLDDIVLDLHGGLASRRQFAQNIARTLHNNGLTPPVDQTDLQRRVERERRRLTQHVKDLHVDRQPWGISIFAARAELLGIPKTAHLGVRFRGKDLRNLDANTFHSMSEALHRYASLGGFTLGESGSPWAGAVIRSTEEARIARDTIDQLHNHILPNLHHALRAAAGETGSIEPTTLFAWNELLNLWQVIHDLLEEIDPAIYELDLPSAIEAIIPATHGWTSQLKAEIASREYKEAKKALSNLFRTRARHSPSELLDVCEVALAQQLAWAEHGKSGIPKAPSNIAEINEKFDQLWTELSDVEQIINQSNLAELATTALSDLLKRLIDDVETFSKLPTLYDLETKMRDAGLGDLLNTLNAKRLNPDECVSALRAAWLRSILDEVSLEDQSIGTFDANEFTSIANMYRIDDRKHIAATAARVRRRCAERATSARDEFKDEADLLIQQSSRKRGYLPVHQLFEATSHVLLELKPCWIMSPLVVSQLLPGRQLFDVVVFDEASQVPPADAIPAILRGKRLVVAGDNRQLPPTAFFATQTSDDDDTDETVTIEGGNPLLGGTEGMESILDALEPLLPTRMLEWHYRSHDERLIAFSNAYVYDRSLTTFPGTSGVRSPIEHVLVPWTAGRPLEEQSSSAEVRRVVDLVLQHARTQPHLSLGVITMGIKHADRIEESLRRALVNAPDLEGFFNENKPLDDRFFVKNLERVQGDERDAIILSIGYSKNENGRLSHNFGPLNREGGERRLNVAITRAREKMTLVSSFGHADLDPARSSAEGVKLLRLYLQYAASGGANLGEAAIDYPQLNPFEISVRDTLTKAGVPLVAQYGSSGYRIDFVASHPKQPGRFVLAIECDGASYHSSRSARDRDRLRQDMLELLGWRFHRIWSSEWFYHRERAVEKALRAYEDAVAYADAAESRESLGSSQRKPEAEPFTPPSFTVQTPLRKGGFPVKPGEPIGSYSRAQLIQVVKWVKSDGLLRTEDELLDEVIRALGYARRGKRIVAAVTSAIHAAV
jgi:very-short-patch-repair endonuclease